MFIPSIIVVPDGGPQGKVIAPSNVAVADPGLRELGGGNVIAPSNVAVADPGWKELGGGNVIAPSNGTVADPGGPCGSVMASG